MRHLSAMVIGKITYKIMRMRGGGSALPGLVVERIDPNFAVKPLSKLPKGVVVISGTNGKTTTTKIVTELLEESGLKVFTNSSGSNFMRGVISALLGAMSPVGKLHYDIAVLELDEAHAVQFVKLIKPKISLLLNIFPDQTDRYGDTKAVAKLLHKITSATTSKIIINREDTLLRKIAEATAKSKSLVYFGLGPSARKVLNVNGTKKADSLQPKVLLDNYKSPKALFKIDGNKFKSSLLIPGPHNAYNAAAALTLVSEIIGQDTDYKQLIKRLEKVEPASGRGETFTVGGQPLELVLVKNTVGLQLSLDHYNPKGYSTMIAMNNAFADGRDPSWLNEVDFSSLAKSGVEYVSGSQTELLSKILASQKVKVAHKNTDPLVALSRFMGVTKNKPRRIYCSYTAMLELRQEIDHLADN